MSCKHGKRGNVSIEWYKDGKPQHYCYGFMDEMTDELLEVCENCRENVKYAQDDLDNYNKPEQFVDYI